MNVPEIARRLRSLLQPRRPGARRGETAEQRAARRYWDRQVSEDHARRGVDDKHA